MGDQILARTENWFKTSASSGLVSYDARGIISLLLDI